MDRIVIIGEAPSTSSDPADPLTGTSGRRIAEYAGLAWDDYLRLTERRNLLSVDPGDAWPAAEAAAAAADVWPSLIGRRTILLGSRVERAFGHHWPPLRWLILIDGSDTAVSVVPHPSGRNLWWNDPANRAAARRFFRTTFGTGDEE